MQFQEIKVAFLVFHVAETSVIVGLMDQRECVCCKKCTFKMAFLH